MRSHFVLSEDKHMCLWRDLMVCIIGLCFAVVFAMLAICPQTAYAYYDRGEVGVSLGTSTVTVAVGADVDITVELSPASDDQTEGCGMAMCPQNCSSSCFDENGQCTCLGTEYQTYYPTAVASSGDSSIAVAVYRSGVLTIYGRTEGETDIAVRASLRQFSDGEAILHVKVEGTAGDDAIDVSDAAIDMPQEAEQADDRQDVDEKTVMGRLIRNVRITDGLNARAYLEEMAGVDGETVFWSGDTYYHPDYSITYVGDEYSADNLEEYNPTLEVSTEATGTLYQQLVGLDQFVIVDFEQRGALPAMATVYANTAGALNDEDEVSLFSLDENTKSLMHADEKAAISGGYATFSVDEGKTYVVSSRDLVADANNVMTNNSSESGSEEVSSSSANQSAQDTFDQSDQNNSDNRGDQSTQISPFVIVLIVAIVIAVAVACTVAVYLYRRSKRKNRMKGDKGDEQ